MDTFEDFFDFSSILRKKWKNFCEVTQKRTWQRGVRTHNHHQMDTLKEMNGLLKDVF